MAGAHRRLCSLGGVVGVEGHGCLDRQPDPVIDGVAETEPAVPIRGFFGQPVGRSAAVRPDHDLTGHRFGVIVEAVTGPLGLG